MRFRLVSSISVAMLTACSSVAVETAPDGSVRQLVQYAHYSTQPKLDFVFVVNVDRSDRGVALVSSAYASIHDSALRIVKAGGGLWNPVMMRAFVVRADNGVVLSPRDQASLVWTESNATRDGADAFASAVRAALVASTLELPRAGGQVALLHQTLDALDPVPEEVWRHFILLTIEDDPDALPQRYFATHQRPRLHRDQIFVATPGVRDREACKAALPALERWAMSNDAAFKTVCVRMDIGPSVEADFGARCFERVVAPKACRVRAFLSIGESCDAARGLRDAVDRQTYEPDLARSAVCDVVRLTGEELELCQAGRRHEWSSGGWCLPAPTEWCPTPLPRLVGGAAPPGATIEMTCDVR